MVDEAKKKIKTPRSKRKYSLPSTRMSFENELAVLKAVVEFSNRGEKIITYKGMKVPNVHPKNVSSELKFLESINILSKGDKRGEYLPSKEAIEFVNNLNWSREEEAKAILRQILLNTWFGDLTIRLLNIKEISVEDLVAELGKEATADPTKDKKGVNRLIEWLKYANILEINENNKINLKEPKQSPLMVEVEKQQVESVIEKESKIAININVSFSIDVNSQTKKEDIIKIIKTIKEALQEIDIGRNT